MAGEVHGGIVFVRFGGKRAVEIENFRYVARSITRPRKPLGNHTPKEIVRMSEEPVDVSFEIPQLITPPEELASVYPSTEVAADFFSLPGLEIIVEEELSGTVLATFSGFKAIEETGEYIHEDYTKLRFQGQAIRRTRAQ